jgi:hypothetical protein
VFAANEPTNRQSLLAGLRDIEVHGYPTDAANPVAMRARPVD